MSDERVDQAVMTALSLIQEHDLEDKQLTNTFEQSIIAMGAMVKTSHGVRELCSDPQIGIAMEELISTWRRLCSVAYAEMVDDA